MRRNIFIVAASMMLATAAFADTASDCAQSTDRDKAITACTTMMKEVAKDKAKLSVAYVNRSAAYQAKGDLRKALSDMTWGVVYNPKNAELWLKRAMIRDSLGQNIRAAADYTIALKADPKLAQAYVGRGEAYRRLGALPQAIADASEALKLDPKSHAALANRAYAQLRLGQVEKAKADAEEALKLNDRNARAYLVRGLAQEKSDKAKAVADVKKAFELDPKLKDEKVNQEVIKRLGV
jgi:tetratricopeptide (TPR) repeat protein